MVSCCRPGFTGTLSTLVSEIKVRYKKQLLPLSDLQLHDLVTVKSRCRPGALLPHFVKGLCLMLRHLIMRGSYLECARFVSIFLLQLLIDTGTLRTSPPQQAMWSAPNLSPRNCRHSIGVSPNRDSREPVKWANSPLGSIYR